MSFEQVIPPTMTISSSNDDSSVLMNALVPIDDDSSDDGADSVTIFEQDDFEKETWGHVVNPTSIVAVVAGVGLFAASPLVILPLAATALGAMQIMSHAHELLVEEYELWKNSSNDVVGSEERVLTSSPTDVVEPPREQSTPEKQPPALFPSSRDSPTSVASLQSNFTVETIKSSDEDEATLHPSTLATQFPPLEDLVATNIQLKGLNGLEFFNVFLGDDAPFSFREFQRKRGDVDIQYGKWTPTHNSALCSSKLQHLKRTISFKTMTKSLFGPPFAVCTKEQQVFMNKRLLVMECKVRLQGIPFSDRFYVQERWILQSPKSTAGANKVAILNVYSQVHFVQTCAFEQQIRSKSQSTLQEVVTSWCIMAQQALQLTIQHKVERASREESLSHVKSENSIEVTHSQSSGKSFVVGEDENEPPNMVVVPTTEKILSPRRQSLASLKRSVLSRMSKRTANQA